MLRQLFLPDGVHTVLEALKQLEVIVGAPVTIAGFARFQAGESVGDVAGSALAGDLEWSFGNAWAEEIPTSVFDLHGVRIFEAQASGPVLRNDRNAVDLLNTA